MDLPISFFEGPNVPFLGSDQSFLCHQIYGERISSDVRPVPSLSASVSDVPVDEIPLKGWKLAKKRAEVRFSAKQKDNLNWRFNEGKTTSAKVDAKDVSK